MSWSFGLAHSWSEAYGDRLPEVRTLVERGAEVPDTVSMWSTYVETPPVLGMQLPYDLAPPMEDLLRRWVGSGRLARVDLWPFAFRADSRLPGAHISAYELDLGWIAFDAGCITDGSDYAWDDAHAQTVDRLASGFTGGIPEDDEGWAMVDAALEKRLYELAQASFDVWLPVVITF